MRFHSVKREGCPLGQRIAFYVGAVLIAIGYEVDSATDTFLGELSAIPDMLRSFIVISGLVPAILCVITLICLKLYPIDSKMRSEINEKIAKLRDE